MPPIQLLWSLAALSLVMAWAWHRQKQTDNAGIVDLIWAGSIGVLAVTFAALGDGWGPRRALIGMMGGLWSLRLTSHLWDRVMNEPEDGRYTYLRKVWSEGLQAKLFGFFQAQAILAVLLAWPFLVLADIDQGSWRWLDGIAVAIWAGALFGESLADRQLAAWRKNPDRKGGVCRAGLWAYSRHPNYFFEWLIWTAYPLMAMGQTSNPAHGWLLWLAPFALLFLILKVTGIPPTEAQSLRSRGDAYRAYQSETNAFFPGPRSHTSTTRNQ